MNKIPDSNYWPICNGGESLGGAKETIREKSALNLNEPLANNWTVWYRPYNMYFIGYIDVGDKCWRPNVLVATCHWQDLDVRDKSWLVTSPTSNISYQHHIRAYYDVCDRCQSLRICLKMGKILLNLAPGWISCLQHDISGILWCLWPNGMSPTCRKYHQHTFLSPTS